MLALSFPSGKRARRRAVPVTQPLAWRAQARALSCQRSIRLATIATSAPSRPPAGRTTSGALTSGTRLVEQMPWPEHSLLRARARDMERHTVPRRPAPPLPWAGRGERSTSGEPSCCPDRPLSRPCNTRGRRGTRTECSPRNRRGKRRGRNAPKGSLRSRPSTCC